MKSVLFRIAKSLLQGFLDFLSATAKGLLALRDRLIVAKLRLIIRRNKKRKPQNEQVLDIYWDDGFAEMGEHWGERTVWRELQYLLTNCQGRVLDIACGSGRTIEFCRPFSPCEFYGCDISDSLIRRAIEKRGLDPKRLTICNAMKMPYEDNFFDHAYSVGSLEHFTEEGIRDFLKECYRVTRGATFHHIPVSKSGKDEGWVVTDQGYIHNSIPWWVKKCEEVYPVVQVLGCSWENQISDGIWLVLKKTPRGDS